MDQQVNDKFCNLYKKVDKALVVFSLEVIKQIKKNIHNKKYYNKIYEEIALGLRSDYFGVWEISSFDSIEKISEELEDEVVSRIYEDIQSDLCEISDNVIGDHDDSFYCTILEPEFYEKHLERFCDSEVKIVLDFVAKKLLKNIDKIYEEHMTAQ